MTYSDRLLQPLTTQGAEGVEQVCYHRTGCLIASLAVGRSSLDFLQTIDMMDQYGLSRDDFFESMKEFHLPISKDAKDPFSAIDTKVRCCASLHEKLGPVASRFIGCFASLLAGEDRVHTDLQQGSPP